MSNENGSNHGTGNDKRKDTDRLIAAKNGSAQTRALPAMPVEVVYQPPSVAVSFENQGDEILFRIQAPPIQEWPNDRTLDAYSVRETFLAVRTAGEATEFLSLSGLFYAGPGGDGRIAPRFVMTWTEFQQWQTVIRLILTHGFFKLRAGLTIDGTSTPLVNVPASLNHLLPLLSQQEQLWLAGHPHGIAIKSRRRSLFPFDRDELLALIGVTTTLEALLATIYLDRLNGVGHALCGLTDCQKIYEITSKHARRYCSQACAHKASVRRRRAIAAEVKAKALKSVIGKRGTKR